MDSVNKAEIQGFLANLNAQNDGSAASDFGGPYSELLPLKYLLDSFRQYN